MKLNSCLLVAAVVLVAVGCQKKKTSSSEGSVAGPAKPSVFHKAAECPEITGVWQHDISIPAGPGTTTDMKVEFGVADDNSLTFNRISREDEVWKVDGMTVTDKSGAQITAYCEAQAIVVEILNADNSYEALSFSADPAAGQLALLTDKTLGRLDHTTQGILLKAKTPKIFTRSTPPPDQRR